MSRSKLFLVNLCISLLLMSSCAVLYTGEDIPEISSDTLPTIKCSATFRFLSVLDLSDVHSSNAKYRISNVHDSQIYLNYLNDLKVFSDVKMVDFPVRSVDVLDSNQFDAFLEKNAPEVETDLFVDVHMTTPFTYHGTGFGMWGGFFSAITLGILPAWWTHKTQFQVYVDKAGKRIETSKFRNDYNSFSSTLFYLIPESETMIGIGKRVTIPHMNELNYIVKDVIEKSCK